MDHADDIDDAAFDEYIQERRDTRVAIQDRIRDARAGTMGADVDGYTASTAFDTNSAGAIFTDRREPETTTAVQEIWVCNFFL